MKRDGEKYRQTDGRRRRRRAEGGRGREMERKKNLGFPRSRSSLCWPRPPLSFGRSRVSIPLGRLVLTTPTSICLALQTSRSIIALFPSPPPSRSPPRPLPSPITGVTRYRAVSECAARHTRCWPPPSPPLPPISYCRGTVRVYRSVLPIRVCKRAMFLRTCVRVYVCVKTRTARTGRGRVIIIRRERREEGRKGGGRRVFALSHSLWITQCVASAIVRSPLIDRERIRRNGHKGHTKETPGLTSSLTRYEERNLSMGKNVNTSLPSNHLDNHRALPSSSPCTSGVISLTAPTLRL